MNTVVRIPLSSGYEAIVDAEDADRVLSCGSQWRASVDGAGRVYVKRHAPKPGGGYRSQTLHAFLTGWPLVDHANGDPLDNRRANLRPATSVENARNRHVRSDSRTGLKGVRQHRPGRWSARIQLAAREPARNDDHELKTWGAVVRDLTQKIARDERLPDTAGVWLENIRPAGPSGPRAYGSAR